MAELHSDWETMRWNPYQIAKLISLVTGKTYHPQMFYNYAKTGRIVWGIPGLRTFSSEEVEAFVLKFINK